MNLDAEQAIPCLKCAEHQAGDGESVSERVIADQRSVFLKSMGNLLNGDGYERD